MRVLHIGTTDSGGAGIGMINLHRALLDTCVDSKVLVAKKTSCDERVFCAEQNLNLTTYSQNRVVRFLQKVIRKRRWRINPLDKYKRMVKKIPSSQSCFFTFPITHYDISQHPLVKEADIIHLHWIADFVDFPTFFSHVDKPVVWTLRDENPGLGGFHYESVRKEYGKYYDSIENDFVDIKRKSVLECKNLTIVAMSDVMRSFCVGNVILKDVPVRRIDNLVDFSLYNSIDQPMAKKALGLDERVFLVLFVAVNLGDPRKNLSIVYQAMSKVPSDSILLCVGKNDFFDSIPDNVICLNSVYNERLMSVIYSAADVFVTPSVQESFGKTTVEALSCGTPVISSDAGIAPEVIDTDNGIILNEVTVEAVAQAIIKVRSRIYDRKTINGRVRDIFAPSKIVKQYLELYDEIVDKRAES